MTHLILVYDEIDQVSGISRQLADTPVREEALETIIQVQDFVRYSEYRDHLVSHHLLHHLINGKLNQLNQLNQPN